MKQTTQMMRRALTLASGVLLLAGAAQAQNAATASTTDPRANLKAGWKDAGEAAKNLKLVTTAWKPDAMVGPNGDIGNFSFMNSDLAFSGGHVYQGNFNGVQVWDFSTLASPKLVTAMACPGGQGDVSVLGKLLFMSVEETRGRTDCGPGGVKDSVSAERFRGVRIFDITNPAAPKLITQVQTCRGSHTHTLLEDPKDKGVVYVYVQGTSIVRSPNELAGCSGQGPNDPNSSLFRIDIIRVPLANPAEAKVVNSPRIFADSTGAIAGLWKGGTHGDGTQNTSQTNQCHDILVYPEIGLAAGACSGNGILLDISNPAAPKRVGEVMDPNFAYWHSANFNNDGTKVLFTDEWGGGTAPRCRVTDKMTWGADAIFTVDAKRKMALAGYYKLPVAQKESENCVAHNGSVIPVPGRDILAQGWYQGGISVFDYTDPAKVTEIAYFDRGPVDSTKMVMGGSWSAYWHNGYIWSTEIARGVDVLDLQPSEYLSQNEIDAAKLIRLDTDNPQNQRKAVWPAKPVVAKAYLDQLGRSNGLSADRIAAISKSIDAAEKAGAGKAAAYAKLAASMAGDVKSSSDAAKVKMLLGVVNALGKAK